jgi:thymidine kinase
VALVVPFAHLELVERAEREHPVVVADLGVRREQEQRPFDLGQLLLAFFDRIDKMIALCCPLIKRF